MSLTDVATRPAPWELTGSGYIFVFRFNRDFVMGQGFVPDELKGAYRGGLGTVMLVDYHTSPVGAYREMLFVPGLFEQCGQTRYTITKIYVSTIDSVINGQENWGIPKELADFQVESLSEKVERFRMSLDGHVVADLVLESVSPRLPVNTRFLPVRPALIQQHARRHLLTAPLARGRVGLASIHSAYVDAQYFPDFGHKRPLLAVRAADFKMTFPVPEVLD
ncbi:MAG: hypothetical protein EA396_13780 [Anaerolineaceae bacterium]|nr:MAG: hypothetical protein EA396_13780 [Anaerolineaceae bacterium]